MPRDASELLDFDRAHVWHPYASGIDPLPVLPVSDASGVRIRLADGRQLVDGMSSWWAAIHGYRVPELERAIHDQLGKMAHVMFGGLTHEPAVALAERLLGLVPKGLSKVFFADSGSVAVEVAIKMALQYAAGTGRSERTKLLTVRGGYHGDTFGAMAVCDPVTGMHSRFERVLAEHHFADVPGCRFGDVWDDSFIQDFRRKIESHSREIAAVILEPVVQGAGGMRFYSPEYLRGVRELCDEHRVLLIADEIATGFGRTGKLFACEHASVVPDILCIGKALTGGTMTLAATLATDEVARGVSSAPPGQLMHGPTFMGNPLACAVALASIDLLLSSPWKERVHRIQGELEQGLSPCRGLPGVADVRVLGAIGVVELEEPVDMLRAQPAFVERGVWLRPFGRLVYAMPPYIVDTSDLARVTSAMCDVVAAHSRALSTNTSCD
jgi:adenosylmethionine---8-amino-7-oxononanoate aminotransferase